MKNKLLILVVMCILLSSCGGHYNTENIVNRATGRIKQNETQVYENKGAYYAEDLTVEPDEFDAVAERTEEKAERIAEIVTGFDGVEKASVIIIGNRAVIGIEIIDNIDDEALIQMKEEISKAVRGREASIDHVAVTAGPELIRRINNVADFVSDGSQNNNLNERTQEIVDELTPAF